MSSALSCAERAFLAGGLLPAPAPAPALDRPLGAVPLLRQDGRACADARTVRVATGVLGAGAAAGGSALVALGGRAHTRGRASPTTTVGPLASASASSPCAPPPAVVATGAVAVAWDTPAALALAGGATLVLASCKAETGAPAPSSPTAGRLHVEVQRWDAAAGGGGEGMGGAGARIGAVGKTGGRSAGGGKDAELAAALEAALGACAEMLAPLGILPGVLCWVLHVDCVVQENAGNLLDALGLAVKAALFDTRLPALAVHEELGDFDVVDDPSAAVRLDVRSVPVCATLFLTRGAPPVAFVDATAEEEECAAALLTVGVDSFGRICSTSSVGALSRTDLDASLESAAALARRMDADLLATLRACAGAPRGE